MKSKLLLLIVMLVSTGMLFAADGKDGNGQDELLRRTGFGNGVSFPLPFIFDGDNPRTSPAISTGYYMVDSEDDANPKWRPSPTEFVDTTVDAALWRRIVSGPNQFPVDYWRLNSSDGLRYFRNPNNMNDSTDDAFAGPIPFQAPFYFNGIRYDSFYVSTNGMIALSNRRYFYDQNGSRTIPDGEVSAHDPNSDDYVRGRIGNGLEESDNTPDDFGYQYIALGNTTNQQGGIRNPNNAPLGSFSFNASIICPAWDDLQLSQFNKDLNQAEDYGKVYFKRSPTGNQTIIYFVNACPIRAKSVPGGTVTFPANIRPGTSDPYVSANFQIILNSLDSTITIVYERFDGVVTVANRPVFSQRFYRDNATIGVRGRAEYPNNGNPVRYTQYTEYLHNGAVRADGPPGSDITTPASNLAIRFKQWKNVLRTVGVKYLIKDPDTDEYTVEVKDPQDFELLVGDPLLGSIQPVATFQNLTNDIQGPNGVNFQEQGLTFNARFRIKNEVENGKIVFNRAARIDSMALATPNTSGVQLVNFDGDDIDFPGPNNFNGVPPYGFVEVNFRPFNTNPFIDAQVGRLSVEVIGEPVRPNGSSLGDCWPFDDTTNTRLFGIKLLKSFSDNVNNFSVSRTEGSIPSVKQWVSKGADVVSGDQVTYLPPPPRGSFGPSPLFQLGSPVIRLNRLDLNGADLGPTCGSRGGDQIISFPIDMRNRHGSVISFSYQRTGRPPGDDYPRGWSDNTLIGPEPRIITNGVLTAERAAPDELRLELAAPSPDGYENIVNIPDNGWNQHPRIDEDGFVNNNPALTIFGAGGGRVGWHELRPDSALTRDEGLRADVYDDGKDQEFHKVFFAIPDTLINADNEGSKYFRFRLRVFACKNTDPPNPADDADNYFVDNIIVRFPTERPDLEIASVQAKWPYTEAPASQSSEIPVFAKITNNSDIGSQSFAVQVLIRRKGDNNNDHFVYCRVQTIPFLPAKREVEIPFPNWNARLTTPGDYVISARIINLNGDPEELNDSTYSEYTLRFGEDYAYDPPNGNNDVPTFSRIPGMGLNLFAFTTGAGVQGFHSFGPHSATGSGRIAVKFEITTQDTLEGFKAYFASLEQQRVEITTSLFTSPSNSPTPQQIVLGTTVEKQRGFDDIRRDYFYDTYTTYRFDNPIVLVPGTYWLAISQLGSDGIELGASSARSGMLTTNYSTLPPEIGANGINLILDKRFRRKTLGGDLINDNRFAFENTRGSGQWGAFMPTVGNPIYPHLDHTGQVVFYNTYSRGSWIPMLRPHFGNRPFSNPPVYVDSCDLIIPVELADFDGVVIPNTGIQLLWETASEFQNLGFDIQRRVVSETGEQDWNSLGFVDGAGNSNAPLNYDYLDQNVIPGTTYQYRLRQVDYDGTASLSQVIERTYTEGAQLAQSYPNPFNESTAISFALPQRDFVTLEIIDMFGNTVNTLVNKEMEAASRHQVDWDGRDANGNELPAGIYLGRLTVGEQTLITKMNLVR